MAARPEAVDRYQQRAPDPALMTGRHGAETEDANQREQPADDEVGDLDPALIAEAQQAQRDTAQQSSRRASRPV